MNDIEYILLILHDLPTESGCRYYIKSPCLWELEGEYGRNWCNNCGYWHRHISERLGIKTIYDGKSEGCLRLHASMVKDIYDQSNTSPD